MNPPEAVLSPMGDFSPSVGNYIVNQDLITKASADASRKPGRKPQSPLRVCLGKAIPAVIKVIAINHAANNNTFSYLHKPSLTEDGEFSAVFEGLCVRAGECKPKARCETAYGRYQLRWPLITFWTNVPAWLIQEARQVIRMYFKNICRC